MEEKILEIEKHIWNSVASEERIGVLDGLSGYILFYNYLVKIYKNEEYNDKLHFVIQKVNDLISEKEPSFSFCSGLAGYGWALLKIKNNDIEIDDDYYAEIDSVLINALFDEVKNNNFDYLHGAVGIAMYFIERYNVKKDKNIEAVLIRFLDEIVCKIDEGLEFLFDGSNKILNEKHIYFGLAHGLSGFLNFLINLKNNLEETKIDIKAHLIKIIAYMDSFKEYDSVSKQFYPSQIRIHDGLPSSARLGWCQGDLGIANAFYNAGLFLNDENIQNQSLEMIENATLISVEESRVNDFALCHGSSGLIAQYYLTSQKSKRDFSKIINVWSENLVKQTKNFSEFKSFFIDKYIVENNILNGAAGLGLLLLTLDSKIETEWLEAINLY